MEQEKQEGFLNSIKKRIILLKEWIKPDRADSLVLQIFKLVYKSIAILLLLLASPVILLILILVFFATL